MTPSLPQQVSTVAAALLSEHPVLSRYRDSLTLLVVGSLGAGFSDDLSDVDIWVVCSDEVSSPLSAELQQAGLRFNTPPPHAITVGGVEAHYFVLPIRAIREPLEAYHDEALFLVSHSLVAHDPNRQFADLVERYSSIPPEVHRQKVERAFTLVTQRASSMKQVLQRHQPLAWLEHICETLHSALELACWLDGQAPTDRKWLMQQAQSCSTAPILIPAVTALLRAIGPTLEREPTCPPQRSPLAQAAAALDKAALDALRKAGFGDIPLSSPSNHCSHRS